MFKYKCVESNKISQARLNTEQSPHVKQVNRNRQTHWKCASLICILFNLCMWKLTIKQNDIE